MSAFKWRHFTGDVILWAVCLYCRYGVSYRNLEGMLGERGVAVDHTTLYRWVQRYAPDVEKRLARYRSRLSFSWRSPNSPAGHRCWAFPPASTCGPAVIGSDDTGRKPAPPPFRPFAANRRCRSQERCGERARLEGEGRGGRYRLRLARAAREAASRPSSAPLSRVGFAVAGSQEG